MQADLLSSLELPSPMMGWLPDESLFSLVSRYHLISGRTKAGETSLVLFGDERQGARHDFPSCIDRFVEKTHGILGESKDIIHGRTILPFYLPFRSVDTQRDAISAMRGASLGSTKYRLGILTSRFRANHPLKACRDCMRNDRKIHHVAYWHMMHQYPGVWICPVHKTLMQESLLKSTGVNRFGLCLPHESILSEQHKTSLNSINFSDPSSPVFQLAQSSIALANCDQGFFIDFRCLVNTYLVGLNKKNLCTRMGGLKLVKIGSDFADYSTAFAGIHELGAIPSKPEEAASLLGRLLRMPRSGTHPLRHLVLINWLFGNWRAFWSTYSQVLRGENFINSCDFDALKKLEITKEVANLRKVEFVDLIRLKRLSVTAASKQIGIAVGTGMAWAAENGIGTPLRSKTLKESVRIQAIKFIKEGASKKQIIAELEISEQTVTRLLRNEVGLRDAWKEAIFGCQREQHRKNWLSICKLHPNSDLKTIRMMIQATYIWLYRHDREWLNKQSPKQLPRASTTPRVDWDIRDAQIAESVRKFGLTFGVQNSVQTIPLWKIYQRLPQLKAKISHLDRMPLTVQALFELTKPRVTKTRMQQKLKILG